MANTPDGVQQVAAKRIGCTIREYELHIARGEKWCTRCKSWHPIAEFGVDRSRGDGLSASCRKSKAAPVPHRKRRPPRGRRYATARDGDKLQARGRVNHLVNMGLLPNPNTVPCTDCGHLGSDRRHEYDHHLGYDAEHHEHVQAVCSSCHHSRQ